VNQSKSSNNIIHQGYLLKPQNNHFKKDKQSLFLVPHSTAPEKAIELSGSKTYIK